MGARRHALGVSGLLLLIAAMSAGCQGDASGVPPPEDRLFFPSALLAERSSRWLLVANSNTDLRYNDGTLIALDVVAAAADRAPDISAAWPVCPPFRMAPNARPAVPCCRDTLDTNIINCDERNYLDPATTVRLGSFGAAMVSQTYTSASGESVERVYVAVRSDPSVTFVDVRTSAQGLSLQCSGQAGVAPDAASASNPECERAWQVRDVPDVNTPDGRLDLPEEPYTFALDRRLGVLYVGHLGAGLSLLDVCAPGLALPRLARVDRQVFPGALRQGITALSLVGPGDPEAPVLAVARNGYNVAGLQLLGADPSDCAARPDPTPRALDVATTNVWEASGFYPSGTDLRGIVWQAEKQRAFVLHRNLQRNPAVVSVVDLTPDAAGVPRFRPRNAIEVCGGPIELVAHDAGRGLRLFVPCFEAGQIYVIDPEREMVESAIDAGRGPVALTFAPADPQHAYVAGFAEGTVSVIDLVPGSPTEYRIVQRIGFPRIGK